MTKETNKILEKIRALEEEKAKLIPLRKEEIFNVLVSSGGLTLDNRLLAGLAAYAADCAGKSDSFLDKLKEIGANKLPSKRSKAVKPKPKVNESISTKADIQQVTTKEASVNG